MFLNEEQISKRLQKGDLVIDPLLDNNQSPIGVYLRLGMQFKHIPSWRYPAFDLSESTRLSEYFERFPTVSAELGQKLSFQPGDFYIATSLEYIQVPNDLVGILYPRSSLTRLGILVFPSIIHPNFQGRLILELSHLGPVPVVLYTGMRIIEIGFVQIAALKSYEKKYKYQVQKAPEFGKIFPNAELEKLRNLSKKRTQELQTKQVQPIAIRDLLSQALKAEIPEKGKALERLAIEIFHTIKGLKVLDVNVHLKTEELDIVLQNNINIGFWRFAGSPIIAECKNWSDKVGAKEISILSEKLRSIGPDAKTGILIAPNSVTRGAVSKIREKRQQGQYIIVLDSTALEEIASGVHASIVIERKYGELLLI